MKKIILFYLVAFMVHLNAFSMKGLYVDGFASILGNTNKEDSLLNYAQSNGFTYLTLYELHLVHATNDLTTVPTSLPLATFISKAKTIYGIVEIGAAGENFWWFDNIISVYNSIHANPNERIDVYNFEFEFWNLGSVGPGQYYCTTYLTPGGYSCDTSGAFAFYMKDLTSLDSLAAIDGVTSELYVGWFNQYQALQMINVVDRILLHSYVANVNNVYSYTQTRLSYLGSGSNVVDVMPIFSSESAFLGPWLASNPEVGANAQYITGFTADTGLWKTNINLLGYQWFDYSNMPYALTAGFNVVLDEKIAVYPNPFQSTINLVNPSNHSIQFELLNCMGDCIYIGETTSHHFELNLPNLSSGMYFLNIQRAGQFYSQKLVRE